MAPKFYIKTYGCQMNDLDGLQMGRLLKQRGFLATQNPEEADLILVNTCSIREKASQKVYSDVGRFRSLKLRRPEVVLGVTGCQAQAEGPHLQKRFPYLDLVVGPDHTARVPDLVEELFQKTRTQTAEIHFEKPDDYRFLNLLPHEDEDSIKAYITIMKGCDNFCSFCIVPYVRGREVCRDSEEILAEVRSLGEQGVVEVTLLGQNVNSYGVGRHDQEGRQKKGKSPFLPFAELLQRIADETSIQRIRFTTSHPKDCPKALLEQFGRNRKLAKHFHLPVQSGSDSILSRMYRGYTREDFLNCVKEIRSIEPQVSLTTDIIVGFPGETDREFEATLELLEEVRFDTLFSFVYSPRPRTTAALYFPDDIPLEVKQGRLQVLQKLQEQISLEKNRSWVGQNLQVLTEGPSKVGSTFCGRSSQNHMVHFEGQESDIGKILELKITHAGPNSLRGAKYD